MNKIRNLPFLKISNFSQRFVSGFARKPSLNLSENQKLILSEGPRDWHEVREHILKTNPHVKPLNLDGLVLNFYAAGGNIEAAKSYMDFLEHESAASIFTKATFFKVLSAAVTRGYAVSEADERFILEVLLQFQQKYEYFDWGTSENLILGVALTREWRKCLQLLADCRVTAVPSRAAYSAVALAALRENDHKTCWDILTEVVQNGHSPAEKVMQEWIRRCTTKDELENIFTFVAQHEILLTKSVVEALKVSPIFKVHEAKISKSGTCESCTKTLETTILTDAEFKRLQDEFLGKVLVRKDVYQKTDPIELDLFKRFIQQNGPFDCIVDGLNVAFSSGPNKNPEIFSNLLLNAVTNLSKFNNKILVIGRKHMERWPKMPLIRRKATTFFTKDLSQDDPFLLYATLKSGSKATFLSRDFMRTHAHLMGDELKQVFLKWRHSHQYQLITAKYQQRLMIKEPCKYKTSAHKVDRVWHLPYVEFDVVQLAAEIQEELQWICLDLDE